jgi:DNA-binding NarL/FixJ family response regulator
VREPDVRAAMRLVHDLEETQDPDAVRTLVLAGLPPLFPDDDLNDADLALLELLHPHLLDALRRAERAEGLAALHLTARERDVLDLVEAGQANVAIAQRLGMRPRTVEKHLEHAYTKLGVCSRTEALARLREITH